MFEIAESTPPSLRSVDETIPVEYDHICSKALSVRISERYASAIDFAEELSRAMEKLTGSANKLGSDHDLEPRCGVLPKGLSSFDRYDSSQFLELLPGHKSVDGLPESILRWKQRIEPEGTASPFSVGLVYGPSGCGKSSFVKAGLLPHLSKDVTTVYLEATADNTEAKLLQSVLRKCSVARNQDLDLRSLFAAIRRGDVPLEGQKLLVVIDQFEQWLYAHPNGKNEVLTAALRQCDGERLQCVLMVRDDFWLSISRFMQQLDVSIDTSNSDLVDLFDLEHARKVLILFGQALGKLPQVNTELTPEQSKFIDSALEGLAIDGKVISVRLALFAEMLKGRDWTVESLRELGGTLGVGCSFLEETFNSAHASPQCRRFREPAQAVLRALLPESGTEIKGHRRTEQELQNACGLATSPAEFAELLKLLGSELRLITPVESAELTVIATDTLAKPVATSLDAMATEPTTTTTESAENGVELASFQLTHDYLVPSLREWLGAKQRSTPQGRAEMLLMDRAALWSLKGERRQLPSFREWFSIYRWTRKKSWSPLQKQMEESFLKPYRIASVILLHVLMIAPIFSTWPSFLWGPKLEASFPTIIGRPSFTDTDNARPPEFQILLDLTILAAVPIVLLIINFVRPFRTSLGRSDERHLSTSKFVSQYITITILWSAMMPLACVLLSRSTDIVAQILFPFSLQVGFRIPILFACLMTSFMVGRKLIPSNSSAGRFLLIVTPLVIIALGIAFFPLHLDSMGPFAFSINSWDSLMLIRLAAIGLLLRPWILVANTTNWNLRLQSLAVATVLMMPYQAASYWTADWSKMIFSLIPVDLAFIAIIMIAEMLHNRLRILSGESEYRFLSAIYFSYAFLTLGIFAGRLPVPVSQSLHNFGNLALVLLAVAILSAQEARPKRRSATMFDQLLRAMSVVLLFWNLPIWPKVEEHSIRFALGYLGTWEPSVSQLLEGQVPFNCCMAFVMFVYACFGLHDKWRFAASTLVVCSSTILVIFVLIPTWSDELQLKFHLIYPYILTACIAALLVLLYRRFRMTR